MTNVQPEGGPHPHAETCSGPLDEDRICQIARGLGALVRTLQQTRRHLAIAGEDLKARGIDEVIDHIKDLASETDQEDSVITLPSPTPAEGGRELPHGMRRRRLRVNYI